MEAMNLESFNVEELNKNEYSNTNGGILIAYMVATSMFTCYTAYLVFKKGYDQGVKDVNN